MQRSILAFSVVAAMLPAFAADDHSKHSAQAKPQAAPAHPHHGAAPAAGATHEPAPAETRVMVDFPHDIKMRMLEAMRGHLASIHLIQQALAEGNYDRAVEVAEKKMGLSSLDAHNARQAPYMPEPMQNMGMLMHSASSRFAVAAQEGDLAKALSRLSEVTGSCVACHATYRAK